METDIIDKLKDLHKQATEEHSHFYVASCVREAIDEIIALRAEVELVKLFVPKSLYPFLPSQKK
jgi:hypothetical protein